ncbi:MAG: class I SAM-dependent methyltransferase [Acidimicrobiales bacterium]
MEARRQRLVQRRGWDRAVAHYEAFWARQLRPAHDLLLGRAGLGAGEHVIDVACGTGLVTLAAATAVGGVHGAAAGRVTATDLSPAMVTETEGRARLAGLGNVEGIGCGAEELTVAGPFDVALCSLGLMYVPDPGRALTEMYRVLRPGGRLVVSVWGERRHCGWAELFPIVADRVTSDVCPLFFALGAPGALASELERAGFVAVGHDRLGVDLDYGDDDEAIGAAFLGGPVALAYAHFDPATRAGAERRYLDSLAGFRTGSGGYRVPGEFVVAWGRRPTDPQQPSTP